MPLKDHTVIFGGSFNPPHFVHQVICLWALEVLQAERVIIVPAYKHIFNKQLAPFRHRLTMCQDMASNLSNKCIVSDIEKYLPSPSTTYDLLKYYSIPKVKLATIIGSELIEDLTKWYKWEEIPNLAKVVIANRTGFSKGTPPFNVEEYPIQIPSTSSSEVRKKIAAKQSIDGMVPFKIKDYIIKNKLYER